MRVLILGGDGMLGHKLLKELVPHYEVRVTLRQDLDAYRAFGLFSDANAYTGVDVRVTESLLAVLADFHPDVVINAVGVIKQRPEGQSHIANLEVNALLPHRLALICKTVSSRLIHISTDCVFSGRRGNYNEADNPDPVDVYGSSKLLGEVVAPWTITLRTSIIGTELQRKTSLVEWFLSQKAVIQGYRKAVFSGFTTQELSRVIHRLIADFPLAAGVYHVSSTPISKYELLCMLATKLGRTDVTIEPDDALVCDRSLDGSRFAEAMGYRAPSWEEMLTELAEEIRGKEINDDASG